MKPRLVSVLASMALAAAALSVASPAANAEPAAVGEARSASSAPVISRVELVQGNRAVYMGGYIDLSEYVPPSTQIHLTVAACGRVVHTETFDGTIDVPASNDVPAQHVLLFSKNVDKSMAGPSIDFSVSFSDPALPPTSYTAYTHTGYPRSCDALEPADDDDDDVGGSIMVSKWSAKKGVRTATVGKTLKVTPTRATGANVAYAWLVGTTIHDRDRSLIVKKSDRGEKVALRITVSKPGTKNVSKWLRYGTVR